MPPTWRATGEYIVGFASSVRGVGTVPSPLRRVAGPVLVGAARYATSPVGSYLELTVLEPVRVGVRAGMCATVMVVDSERSVDAGRAGWRFPKQLGTLHWSAQDGTVSLYWEEGGIAVVGRSFGPAVRLPLPNMLLQAGDGWIVKAAAVLRGPGQLSTVRVKTGPNSALAGLAGRHAGLIMRKATLSLDPARIAGCSGNEVAEPPTEV